MNNTNKDSKLCKCETVTSFDSWPHDHFHTSENSQIVFSSEFSLFLK